jgi:tRNA threonylcarbamoyladenosine biosynthesis protein TsaB
MVTLVLDTATAACSVALIDGSRVLHHAGELVGRGHAERLVPMVEALLRDAGGIVPARVLVDCGPGSFTGVRVGLAAAIGLGIGWGVPVAGYDSLSAIAAAAFARDPGLSTCAAALAGGHGELFVQRFAASLAPLSDLVSLAPADAARAVPDPVVAGAGAAALVAARGTGEARDALPDARDAALLPAAMILPARPIYGRAPDARPKAA